MGKFYNLLKTYSFGGYKTGLYSNNAITQGSLLSLILSCLFLLGLLTAIGYNINEIFIKRYEHITKQDVQSFANLELSKFTLPKALETFPHVTLRIYLDVSDVKKCADISLFFTCGQVRHKT